MPLHLVNTMPGKDQGKLKPGGPYQFGLRATGVVEVGTVDAYVGSSDIRNHALLPEQDQRLTDLGAEASYQSFERIQPVAGEVSRFIAGPTGALNLSRFGESEFARCVYEVRTELSDRASVAGYVRFRKKDFTLVDSPSWHFGEMAVASVYVGLRQHQWRAGLDVFLQGGASPGLLVSGPLGSYGQSRETVQGSAWDWVSLPEDTPIEFWLVCNSNGLSVPFDPAGVPVLELWARAGDLLPTQLVARLAAQYLTVPNSSPTNSARLLFGCIHGTQDELVVEDWAFYPDFRMAVEHGDPRVGHEVLYSVAGPLTYRASEGASPDRRRVGCWPLNQGGTVEVKTDFGYQPGRRATSQSVRLTKNGVGHAYYEREEPTMRTSGEGFSLEAFMAAIPEAYDRDILGAGMDVSDGVTAYRLVMLTTTNGPRLALALNGNASLLSSYLPLEDTDFTSLKLVRLTYDRLRSKLLVDVDGERLLDRDVASLNLPPSGSARARLGHILDLSTRARFDLALANFYPSYLAYEAVDGDLPADAAVAFDPFVSNANSTVEAAGGVLTVAKPAYGSPLTSALCTKEYTAFQDTQGGWAECRVRVPFYVNAHGVPFAARSPTGVGLTLHMGYNAVRLGFFDCGTFGRFFGILPGSVTVDDILDQTAVGRRFSVRYDWRDWGTYRIHYRPYERIEVWVDTPVNAPQIVIPWDHGFDVLQNGSPKFGIEFGHYSAEQGSRSEWKFVRWGRSPGFDLAVEQLFPGDPRPFQYGGSARYLLSFSDL